MKKKRLRPLGYRQASIMEALWERGALTPSEIHATLNEREDVAYTTVHTELGRMFTKGIVRKAKGLASTYEAAISRDDFARTAVSSVLEDLIEAHGAAAIHGFVDLVSQDERSLNVLRRALRKRRGST
jgi:predicted transcriptional regulator